MNLINQKSISKPLSNQEMKLVTGGDVKPESGGGEGYKRCCPGKGVSGECVFNAGCTSDSQCVDLYGTGWECWAY